MENGFSTMTTQHTGTITTWKNDKGFGFITPDQGGQQVFFHISDLLTHQARPGEQMKVSFTLNYDQRQRPRATNIRLTQPQAALRDMLPLVTAGAFFLILTLWTSIVPLPVWIPVIYILVSLITFYIYGVDKASAVEGTQRIPEATLHLLEFLGGWPGALVAQAYYRHKTIKASFQSGYLIAVIANLLVLIVYSFIEHVR
jgi:uncharacterized membrane protein YsdA (DUF1294 family)/cold shock CspA family protein